MTPRNRWLLLGTALVGTLALRLADSPTATSPVVAAATRPAPLIRDTRTVTALTNEPLRRRAVMDEAFKDPFSAPPPPPPAATPVSVLPTAGRRAAKAVTPSLPPAAAVATVPAPPPPPTFPYQAVGQYELEGVRMVFLGTPGGVVAATVGQAIDTVWTLAALNADTMTVRHGPTSFTAALALPARR